MRKKILSLVLILMLISAMFVLTGCGSDEESSSKEGSGGNSVTSVVEIGDYVAYEVKEGETYTATAESTGYDEDQSFETSGDEKWRVLSVEDDGTVNLILDGVIETIDGKALCLKGETGYDNGVDTLNDICAIYGTGEFAESARSMTTNDIYDMFDMEVVVEFYQDEYETEIVGTTEEQLQEIFDLVNTHNSEVVGINNYMYFIDSEIELNSSSLGHAHAMDLEDAITNEIYLDVLLSEDDYHNAQTIWLATAASEWGSSVTSGDDGFVNFGIYNFYYTSYSNGLESQTLYSTYLEKEYICSYYLRPVVTLKSSVTINGGSGTEEDPYILN